MSAPRIHPRQFPDTTERKARHDDDAVGAICELVTAVAFNRRADDYLYDKLARARRRPRHTALRSS